MPQHRRGRAPALPACFAAAALFCTALAVPRAVGAHGPNDGADDGADSGMEQANGGDADEVGVFPNVSVSGVGGLGTPLGWAGLEAAVDPVSWLSVSGGAGVATGTTSVATLATMVRLRVPVALARDLDDSTSAFTAGIGVSHGRFTWPPRLLPCFELGCHATNELWWNNFEVGLERRRELWVVRWFGGFGIPSQPEALAMNRADKKVSLLPYLGVSLGRALF